MNQEQIDKVSALIAAGIDDDTIIETLNISLSQLEKFKNGGKQVAKTTAQKRDRAYKITEEKFNDLKAKISTWNGTNHAFQKANGLSTATFYRIKRSSCYAEYKGVIANSGAGTTEKKTVGVYHEPKKNGDFSIKVKQSPKESQDEVLERIANSLETISYKLHIIIENQNKTKKRGLFRK